MSITEELVTLAHNQGASLAGWASFQPGELAEYALLTSTEGDKYNSAFVFALRHDPQAFKGLKDRPTERYDRDYRRLNIALARLSEIFVDFLKQYQVKCLAVSPTQTLDTVGQRGLVSHKAMAERAGLGIRGRNNLLIVYPFRPAIRLCTILTDLPVEPASEVTHPNPCLTCDNCRRLCPAGAIGETVQEYRIDLCLQYLEEIATEGISRQICGVCLGACPAGKPSPQEAP